MDQNEFNQFCQLNPGAEHIVQWGGCHVWKLGGKVFAIGKTSQTGSMDITFKASELDFHILKSEPAYRPAPYLASRGLKWIQSYSSQLQENQLKNNESQDSEVKACIQASYELILKGLSKQKRQALDL